MKKWTRTAVIAFVTLQVATGALVPWPIITHPTPIQRLTATHFVENYSLRGLGECGGLAGAQFRGSPCRRLNVVVDPAWSRGS